LNKLYKAQRVGWGRGKSPVLASTTFMAVSHMGLLYSVVTNSSIYYLNTIANSQEFSLFKIVFQ